MLVSKIAEGAMKDLGILASGESASGDELADVLEKLQDMLAQWATNKLYVHKASIITLNLSRGAGDYLIGKVDSDCCQYQLTCCGEPLIDQPDINFEISSISDRAWLDDKEITLIRDINESSNTHYIPVWYQIDYPNWIFHVRQDVKQLKLKVFSLPYELNAKDELHFPQSYKRAIQLSLAMEIATLFGTEPSALLIRNQSNAIELLKNSNTVPKYSKNDLPVGVRHHGWNCY